MPHTRSEQIRFAVSTVSTASSVSSGYAHHFAQVLQEPVGSLETAPRICVTAVGTGVLAEALTAALQSRGRQNRSVICLQFPPPSETAGITVRSEDTALSHDIPVEVLLILSLGGRRMKPLLESPEVTALRQRNRFSRRILLMCSDRDELSDLSLYPRWLRDCDPLCLSLDSEVEDLLDAVIAAADRGAAPVRGRKRGSVSPIAPMVNESSTSLQSVMLSEREKELAHLAAAGYYNAEIADQLSLSLSTVKWHLQRVFTKLKIQRRSQLAHRDIAP